MEYLNTQDVSAVLLGGLWVQVEPGTLRITPSYAFLSKDGQPQVVYGPNGREVTGFTLTEAGTGYRHSGPATAIAAVRRKAVEKAD